MASSSSSTFTVLVTGANSGLGFALCCRLIDEFLSTRPQNQSLHLLFTTRDGKKRDETLERLREHLRKAIHVTGKSSGPRRETETRVQLEGVLVDLTQLGTVKALAQQLLARGQMLDAVVWNAGIGGWTGTNYLKATWTMLTDLMQATTYPTYQYSDTGAVAKQKDGSDKARGGREEKVLGQVFTANVFGHYMLTHWLAPLLRSTSRVVWVGSISALPHFFDVEDIQCLGRPDAYESSKRLTDLLVLTSELPSTASYVSSFLPDTSANEAREKPMAELVEDSTGHRPKMYIIHPGILKTNISTQPWLAELGMLLIFYIIRIFGSPWHTVVPYKAAVSATFCVLAPPSQLEELEERVGKGKWGSAVAPGGEERVTRTEVEGWGFCGRPGVVPAGSTRGRAGRWRGLKDTGREEREVFEGLGKDVWREMEQLREDWEKRLDGGENSL